GVSVIKITYGPTEYITANGTKLAFNGTSESATGLVVINVGGGGTFDTGLTERNDFDIIYFDKTEGYREYTFTPEAGTDVRMHDPLNIKPWGSGWTAYEASADGSVTVRLREGRNIIELKNGGEIQYYVLRAKGIDVTVTNTTNPGQPLKAGDTAEIKLLGIESGIEKLAGIYNPGFGSALAPQIKYSDGFMTVESAKGGQYTSLTTEYKVSYTITDEDSARLTGRFWIGEMGDPLGSHRAILPTGRDSNFTAAAQGPYAIGNLPELDLCPAPEPGDTVTVFTTYQTDGTGFAFLNEGLAVPADLSERYGYSDAYRGACATALDALVAVHLAIYGDVNLSTLLAVNKASGSVTTSLGSDAMADGFSFLVNHITPYDSASAYNPSYGYLAYTIREAKLADGDRLQFVNMRDSMWMDYAAWFENAAGQEVTELALKPGEEMDLTLKGFYAAWYSSLGPDVYGAFIDAICESNIYTLLVEDEGGYSSAALDDYIATTDDTDGTFTLSFDAKGTYYITAGDTDWDEAVIYPLLKVTVTAPVITISAQPQSTTVTEGKISGSLSVDAAVAPAGTLSYQWYSSTSATNAGGSAISGAASASFAIPTSLTAGKYYYYVVVSSPGAESVASAAVTVTVTAKEKDTDLPEPEKPWASPFIDVAAGDWFYKYVEYAYKNKLMSGVGGGRFDPNGQLTRAMVVTILANSAGADISGGETWWSKAREWGMTNGVTDGTSMESPITREQLVTMLKNYARFSGLDTSARADLSKYTDGGAVSFWAVEPMQWAVAVGLITGKSATEIAPADGATRAEAATILMKYLETVAK
ncbi:MAG: S-layer homology domain-containing protein, partial [Oscillospiraceae bacterium]|nr:S-layer homology domain-containing protein [Oscillospiraceae bacterium]